MAFSYHLRGECAIYISSHCKIQGIRQIKKTDITQTKHYLEKQTMQSARKNKTSLVQSPHTTLGQERNWLILQRSCSQLHSHTTHTT